MLSVIMLSIIMMSVIMMSVIMMSVIMLSVIMLSVVMWLSPSKPSSLLCPPQQRIQNFQEDPSDALTVHFNAFHRKAFREWTLSTSNNWTSASTTMCLANDKLPGSDNNEDRPIYFVAKVEGNLTAQVMIRCQCY